ncbi:MAG: LamG domain-containing protein [Acidobacteria bacterium]|nr:LamG domain-containing protein [Acidobacteriota bacterium]
MADKFTALTLSGLASAQTASNLGIALDGSVPFSVDAWIRPNGASSLATILGQDGVFQFAVTGRSLTFSIVNAGTVQSSPSFPLDGDQAWHYVCATYDGSNVRLYVDGAFSNGQSFSGTAPARTAPFLMGAGLQGLLSAVRVYSTALDAETVLANMYGTPAAGSYVCWFDFSQAPPVDRGSGNLPITLNASASMTNCTPCVRFSDNQYAEPVGDEGINPGGAQVDPYTVQAWVYTEGPSDAPQTIFANSDLTSDAGMALFLQSANNTISLVSSRGSNILENQLVATTPILARTWTNVATTYDGVTLSVYVNSQLSGNQQFGPIPIAIPASRLHIGAATVDDAVSPANNLHGCVSRIEVWDRALTAAELATYAAAAPVAGTDNLRAEYDFTSSPVLNQVNGHTVGLAAGAMLCCQSGAATSELPAEERVQVFESKYLNQEDIQRIRDSLDYTAFLAEHESTLRAAMQSDVDALAADPAGQTLVQNAWNDAIARLRNKPTSVFSVTRHHVSGRHILVAHTASESYVCYEGEAAINECAMWKVQLFFVVLGGALDALFAIKPALGPKAIEFIVKKVLSSPKIGAALAVGSSMTATRLYSIVKEVYNLGVLRDLLWLVIDLSWWTLIRVVASFLLKLLGVGYAQVIAALVAAVATFIFVYVHRPVSCDPLPTVNLAGIKFNFDPTGASIDALAIRRNYTSPVAFPEWTPASSVATDSPAAYSIAAVSGKTIQVQASFTTSASGSVTIPVRADGGGILGSIAPVNINFLNGKSNPEWVTLNLSSHQIGAAGIQLQDITWTWFYQPRGSAFTTMKTTKHRIYALLTSPPKPWVQSSNRAETQLPWTAILDLACVWATGKNNATDAATAIIQKVNTGLNLVYDTTAGASTYTGSALGTATFLASSFLLDITTKPTIAKKVNCTDCATIVATFANAVGCGLGEWCMTTPAWSGFLCNEIIAIGTSNWAYPFPPGNSFRYHEVAWLDPGSYNQAIFDACLQFDSSSNPWDWSSPSAHAPVLPLNVPFTTQPIPTPLPVPTPFTIMSYRERLAQNSSGGIGSCQPVGAYPGNSGGRRKLV